MLPLMNYSLWRDGPDGTFALKAAKAFGGHHCFCSMKTFSEIKERCDVIERQTQAWMNPVVMAPLLNSVNIHVDDTVPNGALSAQGLQTSFTPKLRAHLKYPRCN